MSNIFMWICTSWCNLGKAFLSITLPPCWKLIWSLCLILLKYVWRNMNSIKGRILRKTYTRLQPIMIMCIIKSLSCLEKCSVKPSFVLLFWFLKLVNLDVKNLRGGYSWGKQWRGLKKNEKRQRRAFRPKRRRNQEKVVPPRNHESFS